MAIVLIVSDLTPKTSNQIVNMADAAAARREARRRKILENSHNRLQRISGKSEGENSIESSFQTIIPNKIYEAPTLSVPSSGTTINRNNSFNNGVVVSEVPSMDVFTTSSFENIASDDVAEITNESAAFMSPTSQPADSQQGSRWEKLILYKYDVVLVSLLVQFLYSVSVLTFDETYFFLPIVVYIVTKIIWFPAPCSSSFANALLLLNGISVQKVERIMSIMRWVSMFSQDACVYLFTTICIQALYTTVKDCYVT